MRANPLPYLLLFLLVFVLLIGYAGSAFVGLLQSFAFSWSSYGRAVWIIFHLLLVVGIFTGVGAVRSGKRSSLLMNLSANSLLALLVAELVLAMSLLPQDVWRLGLLALGDYSELPQRSAMGVQLSFALAALPLLAFAYGTTKGKYRYTVKRVELKFSDLPAAFDGFTLTQISDVHSGSFTHAPSVEKGIERINSLKSDLFVFTGDLVNNVAEEFRPWIAIFSRIQAPFGQFSIYGNHDYGDYTRWPDAAAKAANLSRLADYHAQTGFRLLRDQSVELVKGGQKIYLLGIENWGEGFSQYGDFEKTLKGVPADGFKILLSHDPTHFEAQVKRHPNKVHLTLSGHTHGMQFGIELFGFKWSPVQYRYKRWAGLYQENDRYLYVNRGFGFLGFSGRVGIWPEITQITLRKA